MLLNLSSRLLVEEFKVAKYRIYLCVTGVSSEIVDELIAARMRNRELSVIVLVDTSAHSRRLGYGDHESIIRLSEMAIPIFELPDTRLAFCVIDSRAWVFSQLPALVEKPDIDSGFNCLELGGLEVDGLANFVNSLLSDHENQEEKNSSVMKTENSEGALEISVLSINVKVKKIEKQALSEISKELELNPPQPFNVSRQIIVFNSRLEFVELELIGGHIERHVFGFPDEIKKLLTDDFETQKRLSASYKLIGSDSKVSSKEIRGNVEKLRKRFLKPIGKLGRVILRTHKAEFDSCVEELKLDIEKYSSHLKVNLEKELNKSKRDLIKAVVDRVKANPPDALKYGIEGSVVRKSDAQEYLNSLLDRYMPSPEKLLSKIILRCDYKAVTYEMLSEPNFQDQVRGQFPLVEWVRPFDESSAAKGTDRLTRFK